MEAIATLTSDDRSVAILPKQWIEELFKEPERAKDTLSTLLDDEEDRFSGFNKESVELNYLVHLIEAGVKFYSMRGKLPSRNMKSEVEEEEEEEEEEKGKKKKKHHPADRLQSKISRITDLVEFVVKEWTDETGLLDTEDQAYFEYRAERMQIRRLRMASATGFGASRYLMDPARSKAGWMHNSNFKTAFSNRAMVQDPEDPGQCNRKACHSGSSVFRPEVMADCTQHCKSCKQGVAEHIVMHDSVVNLVVNAVRKAGGLAFAEPNKGIEGYRRNRQRVDIVITFPGGKKKVVMDVHCVACDKISALKRQRSKAKVANAGFAYPKRGLAVHDGEVSKTRLYGKRLRAVGGAKLDFVPFVVDDCGFLNKEGRRFLDGLCKAQKEYHASYIQSPEGGNLVEDPVVFRRQLWRDLSFVVQMGWSRRIMAVRGQIVHDSFLKNTDVVQKELEIMDANGFDLSNYDLKPSDDEEVDVA